MLSKPISQNPFRMKGQKQIKIERLLNLNAPEMLLEMAGYNGNPETLKPTAETTISSLLIELYLAYQSGASLLTALEQEHPELEFFKKWKCPINDIKGNCKKTGKWLEEGHSHY